VVGPIAPALSALRTGSKVGTLTIVGGASHKVQRCVGKTPRLASTDESISSPPDPEIARVGVVKQKWTDRLMRDQAVIGVGIATDDRDPTKAVIAVFVDGNRRIHAPIPADLDGVRTRVTLTGPMHLRCSEYSGD
jgi:hypothetical protein